MTLTLADPGVMASPPAFATSGPGGSSPITSPVTLAYNDARVTLLGCVPVLVTQFATNYYASSTNGSWTRPIFAVEFDYTGSDLALRFRNVASGVSAFWVFVDGQPATSGPQTSSAASGGSLFRYRITFASRATRRIRIYLHLADYGGLEIGPTDTVDATTAPASRLAILGDSYVEGTGAFSPPLAALATTVGRWLGTDTYLAGQGGTGYANDGGGGPKAAYTNSARIAAIVAANPSCLIVFGSSNDDTSSPSAVATAAASLFSQLATALPDCAVIVVGPPPVASAVPPARAANDAALATAAAAAPNVLAYISPISDASGQWITDANKAAFVASDGTHPTGSGHYYWAQKIATAMLALAWPSLSVVATADRADANQGDIVTVTVAITNTGNRVATGVSASLDVSGLAGVTGAISDGGSGTTGIAWSGLSIAAGATKNLTVAVTMGSPTNGSTVLMPTAVNATNVFPGAAASTSSGSIHVVLRRVVAPFVRSAASRSASGARSAAGGRVAV